MQHSFPQIRHFETVSLDLFHQFEGNMKIRQINVEHIKVIKYVKEYHQQWFMSILLTMMKNNSIKEHVLQYINICSQSIQIVANVKQLSLTTLERSKDQIN